MKYIMTTIVDTVAEKSNGSISLYENVNVAKRSFENSIRILLQEGNPQNIPIEDLRQYKIGEFDNKTLEITPCNEFIEAGSTFLVKYASLIKHTQPIQPTTIPDYTEIPSEETEEE